MNIDKLSMAELTDKVNEKLKIILLLVLIVRYSSTLSDELKIISQRYFRCCYSGKEKWFGELHVNKLFALRNFNLDGLSFNSLKKKNLSGSSSLSFTESNFSGVSASGFTGALSLALLVTPENLCGLGQNS
jgi:hypothetical protein